MRRVHVYRTIPPRRWHSNVSNRSWTAPTGHPTGVTVYNSLSSEKTPLTRSTSSHLTWYSCGPTVYDHAHLGHARTYVAFDIMQRILTDVFGVPVHHVMGMTDVDDKIVKRAAADGIPFIDLARKYEAGFQQDMTDLGVRPPSAITRVSEHIPEIIRYCEKILENGYGYVANGSVYFDSESFAQRRRAGRALLDKNEEQQVGQDEELLAEKRRAADFALWKAVPPTEPSWSSPWGMGRPGWHVECSAMSSSIFGETLDVHTGGIDLRFPHHENEISQCLAHCKSLSQWPNYFLHAGHLYIAGAKMSKSLKNFISIREFLGKHSATLFRLFCLSMPYRTGVDYSEDRMNDAAALERKLRNFLNQVCGVVKQVGNPPKNCKWRAEEEGRLQQVLLQTQTNIRAALADDFNTPLALQELNQLISATNVYMLRPHPSPFLLLSTSAYVEWLLNSFGLGEIATSVDSLATKPLFSNDDQKSVEAIASFRSSIRRIALTAGPIPADLRLKSILKECDVIRDKTMPTLGYRIEDRPDYGWLLKSTKV